MMMAIVLTYGCARNPKGYRILIPESFSGTAYIYHDVPEAERLTEDGYRLVILNEKGVARVPPEPEEIGGKPYTEYWLYSGNQRKRMSPYKLGGGATIEQTNSLGQRERFFQFQVLKEERPHDTFWSVITHW
jgi:hypothetical protein